MPFLHPHLAKCDAAGLSTTDMRRAHGARRITQRRVASPEMNDAPGNRSHCPGRRRFKR
ncbi:hypothetical protein EMIT0111MI5_10176 [Burkholderia sp. IT-111MI5]